MRLLFTAYAVLRNMISNFEQTYKIPCQSLAKVQILPRSGRRGINAYTTKDNKLFIDNNIFLIYNVYKFVYRILR